MKTVSILIQTLCAPCACRCRYCLLSWDGKCSGAPWDRSVEFALNFREWQKKNREELTLHFTFGYSMEHPRLKEALRVLRDIGSPQSEFLQCDGMSMRSADECIELMEMLRGEGVRTVNFTVYGDEEYHDRFACRRGDHALIMRMLKAAVGAGLNATVGLPVTSENAPLLPGEFDRITSVIPKESIFLFIPHEEGRGRSISGIRASRCDIDKYPAHIRSRLNSSVFKTEAEWLNGAYKEETERTLILTLRTDNIEHYESMSPEEIVIELESLDDEYYNAFPSFNELAERYGDREGEKLYRQRDLFYHYRRLYAEGHNINVYDVTDERQTGTRRF